MLSNIEDRYNDIISMTFNRIPNNYKIIDFRKFLQRKLLTKDNFISVEMFTSLQYRLIAKYNDEKSCFNAFGILSEISFDELFYYQNEVGITGPKFSHIDDPVAILKVDDKCILWNGYHRALFKIINNDTRIKGYVLKI